MKKITIEQLEQAIKACEDESNKRVEAIFLLQIKASKANNVEKEDSLFLLRESIVSETGERVRSFERLIDELKREQERERVTAMALELIAA